jgi:hypothetical protein
VSVVNKLEAGVQYTVTSTLSKNTYILVLGAKQLPANSIVLGLTKGTIPLEITLVPKDSSFNLEPTEVCVPVLF